MPPAGSKRNPDGSYTMVSNGGSCYELTDSGGSRASSRRRASTPAFRGAQNVNPNTHVYKQLLTSKPEAQEQLVPAGLPAGGPVRHVGH